MTETTSQNRVAAEREAIIGYVAANPVRPRRALLATSLVLAGALAGAGASTAAIAATGNLGPAVPVPSGGPAAEAGDAVPAPPGTVPGAPIISLLGEATTRLVVAAEKVDVRDRPGAATHIRVTVTPLTAGGVSFGTDPDGSNPAGAWDDADLTREHPEIWMDVPLDASTAALYFDPERGFTGMVTLQFVTHVPTRFGVNARGETFGIEGGPNGTPDLVAVTATAPNGEPVEGYIRSTEMGRTHPDRPGLPTSPEQALEWQNEREEQYPNGWDVPAYASDGVTQVGTFHMG